MNWSDTIHLKAPSREDLEAALIACGWATHHPEVREEVTDEDGNVKLTKAGNPSTRQVSAEWVEVHDFGAGFALDVIGDIYTGGTYDNEGEVIEPPVKIDGYHANVRVTGELPDSLKPFVIEVANPVRVFA
jgi:hypothetical protein